MTPESYYFGTRLAARCDYYAFPRTGSHYLWACLTGLLDLVFFRNDLVDLPETRQRAQELNPHAYYVLRLREDGVPVQPVYLNAAPNGLHGLPQPGDWPLLILIRDPHPTIYSWYHTAVDRWQAQIPDRVAWIQDAYTRFSEFYRAARAAQDAGRVPVHLVRFEDLQRDPAVLTGITSFLEVSPKLKPEFVHWWTQFDRMVAPGQRTFFRGGDNRRWQQDDAWMADWRRAAPRGLAEFGYSDAP